MRIKKNYLPLAHKVVLVLLYKVSLNTLIHPSNHPNFIADVEDSLNVNKSSLCLRHDTIQFKPDSSCTTKGVIGGEHHADLSRQIGSVQVHTISSL